MYWYKMPDGQQNFGDDLGPYLVSKLSGKAIRYVPIVRPKLQTMVIFLRGLKSGKYKIAAAKSVVTGLFKKQILVTVGSVISKFNNPNVAVWGAGLMSEKGIIHKARFHAVRGKYTQARIKELGFEVPEALGDPALLLPLIIPAKGAQKYQLGIIPHYIHYEKISAENKNEAVLIINLLDDIEKVVQDITSCAYTISSSLHGIIVSHAYSIPSLWYQLSEKKLSGDNIKFADYFSSVAIDRYTPFELPDNDVEAIIAQIKKNPSQSMIQNDLALIQKHLLSVAPFPLLQQYAV